MFAQREKKRHLKIYIYSEPVQDQTAKLICSSFNPCSAPSLQFHSSPIDFLHRPSPWWLQLGLLSPLLGPEPWLLWDRVHLTAVGNDVSGKVHGSHFTHTHRKVHTIINFSPGPFWVRYCFPRGFLDHRLWPNQGCECLMLQFSWICSNWSNRKSDYSLCPFKFNYQSVSLNCFFALKTFQEK